MFRALLLAGAVALIASALTSAGTVGPPAACTNKSLGSTQRGGYLLMCRPGGAVVSVMGTRIYINRSWCLDSSVHFGRVRWNNTLPATNSLEMTLTPVAAQGPVDVIDGSAELVLPDGRVVAGTVRGRAYVKPTYWQGTFRVTVSSRTFGPLKLTGHWTCG